MNKQAGWRTRQHTVVNNCGRLTDIMLWRSSDTDRFHVRVSVKEMGQQSSVTFETVCEFDEALDFYLAYSDQALREEVHPPDPSKVGYTIVEQEDGEVVVAEHV